MGLFDKFKKVIEKEFKYEPESEQEAWVGILYSCIMADGEIVKVEENTLSLMLITKKKFEDADVPKLFKKVAEAQFKIGGAKVVDACVPLIRNEEKETILVLSIELVLADGVLDEDEEKIIEYIADKLEIDEELIDKIVEVMLIRNRGNHVFF